MQKTLIALGLAAALTSFQAQAADVTLYGLVDYGFSLQHRTPVQGESDTTFKMNSGMNSGSRFGMKGTEDLGNGMKVGFVLENGFSADSGAMGQDGASSGAKRRSRSRATSVRCRSGASAPWSAATAPTRSSARR